ncbi:asparagine synthase (glutamine-hydrolyzing) [Burkholderia sola]|uniref:asparagine synthase (glutamine-hydrolyzing) n=1 Tax=Burkholderia TaxID=32008 RepID=UPI001AE14A1D|nr:asparagine synthase (glutamine-hydrolyzing) [Burkholderia sp. AcTa6-5]MBP0713544.1 asparagine synthase (glutamine-hydrolyzing) [Burkholderia sp. AcTa6-5]
MCGFVVACHRDAVVPAERIEHALDALRHRGPDGRALWRASDGRCAMGFHRLALVGPPEQMQPFHAEDVWTVVNGEIYGHAALRRELEARGARFVTESDCEVLLHGYRDAGIDFVRRLNGEFAGVIWDPRVRKLYAVRDRWGVKPLYYRLCEDGIHLASEIKALVALGARLRWNHGALFQHFFASIGPAQTLFDGIHQVPPGHVLEWDAHGWRVTPYEPEPTADGGTPPRWAGEPPRALMAQLRERLDLAVRDRLAGDVPIACHLSGGVDSATLAALAVRHRTRGLEAFTVDFGAYAGDAAAAAEIAAGLGIRHRVLALDEARLVAHFEDAVRHAETIGFNFIGSARWMLASAVAAEGYKAVLSGDGADELFGGYGFSVIDGLCERSSAQRALIAHVLESGRSALAAELGQALPIFELAPARHGDRAPYLVTSWNHQRSGMRVLLAQTFLDEFHGDNPYDMLMEATGGFGEPSASAMQRSLHLWRKSLFANHILVSERLDMAHGVETRYPYLDNRVAAVAQALPDAWLADDLREKRFLREAVASLTPECARRARKQPFEAPPITASRRGAFRRYLQDVLHGDSVRHSSIFDRQRLLKLESALPSLSSKAKERIDSLLMMALSFFVLQRAFGVSE